MIRENFQAVIIAQGYAMNGAACLSVLTDKEYFQDSEAYSQLVRERCPLPVYGVNANLISKGKLKTKNSILTNGDNLTKTKNSPQICAVFLKSNPW